VPIYNALDPETHRPAPSDPAFESALAFLGNRLPDREARVYEFFFGPASKLPNRQFVLGERDGIATCRNYPTSATSIRGSTTPSTARRRPC
jgi:spore maturation protein CgeB